MRDAFLWGSEWAAVWADVVSFPSEKIFELVESGVGAAFGAIPKRPKPASLFGVESVEAATPTPSLVPRGKESAGGGMCLVKVGDWGHPAWAASIEKGR